MGGQYKIRETDLADQRTPDRSPAQAPAGNTAAPQLPPTAGTDKARAVVLSIVKDTLCKTLFSLLGAVANKLGGSGAGDVIAAFPTLYRVANDHQGTFDEKLNVLRRGIDQLPERPGEDGNTLALIKALLSCADTLVGAGTGLRTGTLTLIQAQNSLAQLKILLESDAVGLLLPDHYVPGLAHAMDVLDSLLEDAHGATFESRGWSALRMTLRIGGNENALAYLPLRLQWALRLMSSLGSAVVEYLDLAAGKELSLVEHGALFLSVVANSVPLVNLTIRVREQIASDLPDNDWRRSLGQLLLSVGSLAPYPARQPVAVQLQWCLQWLRSNDGKALTIMLIGEARQASLTAFLDPATSLEDPLGGLVSQLMPESVQWLKSLFEQMAELSHQLKMTPEPIARPPQGSGPEWPHAAQLLTLVLASPMADSLLEQLPQQLTSVLKPALGIARFANLSARDQWVELMRLLSDPEMSGWLQQALPEPDARLGKLIEGLATLQGVLRRCMDYPLTGSWDEQLGWGLDLLGTGSLRPLLGLLLPAEQADILLAPFEWMNKISHFPHEADAREQAQWLAKAMAGANTGITALLPGVEQLESALQWAPLIFHPQKLAKKAWTTGKDLASSSSPTALATRGLISAYVPVTSPLLEWGIPAIQVLSALPVRDDNKAGHTSSNQVAQDWPTAWGPAARHWAKALGERLWWIAVDPQMATLKALAVTTPTTLTLITLLSCLRQIDELPKDAPQGPFSERVWKTLTSQIQWLRGWPSYLRAYGINAIQLCQQWASAKAPVEQTEQLVIKAIRDFKANTQISAEAEYLLDLLPLLPVLFGAIQADLRLPPDLHVPIRLSRAIEYLAQSPSPVLADFASKLQAKLIDSVVDLMLLPAGGRTPTAWRGLGAQAASTDAPATLPAVFSGTTNKLQVSATAPWQPPRLESAWGLAAGASLGAVAMMGSTIWTIAAVRGVHAKSLPPYQPVDPEEPATETTPAMPPSSRATAWFKMLGGMAAMLFSGAGILKAYEIGSARNQERKLFEPRPDFPDTSTFEEIYRTLLARYGDAVFDDSALMDTALDEVLGDPSVVAFSDADPATDDDGLGELAPHAQAQTDDLLTRLRTELNNQRIKIEEDVRERRRQSPRALEHVQEDADEWIAETCARFMPPMVKAPLDGDTRVTMQFSWTNAEGGLTTSRFTLTERLRVAVSANADKLSPAPADARDLSMSLERPAGLPDNLFAALVERMPPDYRAMRLTAAAGWHAHPHADAWIAEQVRPFPAARQLTGDTRTLVSYDRPGTDYYVPLRETVSPDFIAAHESTGRSAIIAYAGYPEALSALFRQGMGHDYTGFSYPHPWSVPRALLRERLVRELAIPDSEAAWVNPDDDRIHITFTPRTGAGAREAVDLSLEAFLKQREALLEDPLYNVKIRFPPDYSALMRYRLISIKQQPPRATARLVEVFIAEVNALHSAHLRAQGLTLGPETNVQVQYTEQLTPQTPPTPVNQQLPLRDVVDPGFKALFSNIWYPRRSDPQIAFLSGFPSRELTEIRDLLAAGLPPDYAPWGSWTRDRLLLQITRRSGITSPLRRWNGLIVKVYNSVGGRGVGELSSTHSLSLHDYLMRQKMPTLRSTQYRVVTWPEHFNSGTADEVFGVQKALEDATFLETYQQAERRAGRYWVDSATPRPLPVYEVPKLASSVSGNAAGGVWVPDVYETRSQYDELFKRARQRLEYFETPILQPERLVVTEAQRRLDQWKRAHPSAAAVSALDDIVVTESVRSADGLLVPTTAVRTPRTFKRWQLLAGHHKREEALSPKSRYAVEVPRDMENMIDWIEAHQKDDIEQSMRSAANTFTQSAKSVEDWQEFIAGQLLAGVLERHETSRTDCRVTSAIDLFLQNKLKAQRVTFNKWPLSGMFYLPVSGSAEGLLFSTDSATSYFIPSQSYYSMGEAKPVLNTSPSFKAWITAHLSVYHRYSLVDSQFDYGRKPGSDRPYFGSASPYAFEGSYTLAQLPAALHKDKTARMDLDIDALVYTRSERQKRLLLDVVRLISTAAALSALAASPGIAVMIGFLASAVDTAAAFAQIGEALSPDEEDAARRSAIIAAFTLGISAAPGVPQVIGKARDITGELATRWISGYQRLRPRLVKFARRPNPALRTAQDISKGVPINAGVARGTIRVGERFFIKDGEYVFEIQPHGSTLRLLDETGRPTEFTVEPDPQSPGEFMQGKPFDSAQHSADLDPAYKVTVDLGETRPGDAGKYAGVYSLPDPQVMNRQLHYCSDGQYTYSIRWDADNQTWRMRRGNGQIWNDDPVRYDTKTGKWQRHLDAGGEGGQRLTPIMANGSAELTLKSYQRGVGLAQKAKKAALQMLDQATKVLESSSNLPRRLGRYFFGWDEAFREGNSVTGNMQNIRNYVKHLRRRLNALDVKKNIQYHPGEFPNSSVVASSHVGIYRTAASRTSVFMELALEKLEDDISRFGESAANLRFARTLVHEYTHLEPPVDFFQNTHQVIDLAYVPRLSDGDYELTEIVMLGLYKGQSAMANADSYAHYISLLQSIHRSPASVEHMLEKMDNWYAELGELQPTTHKIAQRAAQLAPVANESRAAKLDRAQELLTADAKDYIRAHRHRLAPGSELDVGQRTLRSSVDVARDPNIRTRVFTQRPQPDGGGTEVVTTAWQAELRVEEAAVNLSPAQSSRLARETTADNFRAYLNGGGHAVADYGTLRRIPPGWRIVFLNERQQMIHAMLSHGEGKFAGWGNAIIDIGHFPRWSVLDLGNAQGPLEMAGDGLFVIKKSQATVSIRMEQHVPLLPSS
ncbi:hypothetical protein SFA35_07420 [Pseudomonas sp. HR96]|nr:hypothetical protein [Pseudomonas sp. HR96]WPP01180.1 hypothetical protein SFA35_07420 [Pseudomonas sp. HR96]